MPKGSELVQFAASVPMVVAMWAVGRRRSYTRAQA